MRTDKLKITGPCPIDLDTIDFDRTQAKSHCSHCDKNVHILSNMTEVGAKDFLRKNAGRTLCVSYKRDARGNAVFKQPAPTMPSPRLVPLDRLRSSARRPTTRMQVALGLGLAVSMAACTPHASEPTESTPAAVDVKPPVGEVVIPVEPEPQDLPGEIMIPVDIDDEVDGEMEIPEPCPVKTGKMKVRAPEPEPEPVRMSAGLMPIRHVEPAPTDSPAGAGTTIIGGVPTLPVDALDL